MKVIAVITNNSEKSRSAAVAREMIRGAQAAGHEVTLYELNKMPLLGCVNCRSCRNQNCDCILEDALKPYFEELHGAGAVILAAPNYNSQPSGALITFMNRHYCLLNAQKEPRLDHDIKLLSVFAQGAPADYAAYPEHYQWFLGCFKTKRLISTANYIVGGDSNLSADGEMMKNAYQAGYDL